MLVVLPAPLMPATRITVGPAGANFSSRSCGSPQPAIICSFTIRWASSAFLIFHAHVGLDEFLLHLSQKCIVDSTAGDEERADIGVEHLGGLPQGAFELVE